MPRQRPTVPRRGPLHEALSRCGLRRQDLAALLARPRTWVQDVLARRRPLRPEDVERIRTALGLDGEETRALLAWADPAIGRLLAADVAVPATGPEPAVAAE